MLHRMARPVFLTLLIAAGIASAGFLWFTQQRIATARQQAAAMDTHADALIGGLSELSAALQAYVAPGQNITEWSKRATALLTQLTSDASALAAAADATEALAVVGPGIETLTRLDARVRDYLRSGDDLMAADLAFTEARDTTGGMVSALRDWRAEVARAHNLPAYVIFHDATLAAIAQRAPRSADDLQGISGIGIKKLEAYGDEVLRVVGL